MAENKNSGPRLKLLIFGLAAVQLLDIIIHAATDQLEVLRVSSNAVIFIWLAVVAPGKQKTNPLSTAVGSIGMYLMLNFIFLAREGVTNADQGGELRGMLFALLFLTLSLSIILTSNLRTTLAK